MKFVYQARTSKGEIRRGIIEASSKEAALSLLQGMDLFVTYLEPEKTSFYEREITLFRRISFKELSTFFRQLAILLNSQVSLVDSLSTLASQTKNRYLKEVIIDLTKEVEAGSSFSKALLTHKEVFSELIIGTIKAGEKVGKLGLSTQRLAEYLERENTTRSKIKGAMIYPTMIFLVFCGVAYILVFSVLPSLEKILIESQVQIPLFTRMIFFLFRFLKENFLYIFFGLIFTIFYLIYYIKTEKGKEIFEKFLLSFTILGPLFKKSLLARISENLSTLLSSGIMIIQALEIVEKMINNKPYEKALSKIKEETKKGFPLSSGTRTYPELFPPFFTQMVEIGEKTGRLSEIFEILSKFYQNEFEKSVEDFFKILEPTMIVLMAFLVGTLMISTLMPLYQIMGSY